jgi:hypothetical protein
MLPEERTQAQYLSLSNRLKRLAGEDFEIHRHPAVILDRASGPTVRVWGWWSAEHELPCLLWCGDLGWSTTVVMPDAFDSEGYERVFWSHRIKLLDLALANAIGPGRTLEELELRVASDPGHGLDASWSSLKGSLLWGILQLRAARAQRSRLVHGGAVVTPTTGPEPYGATDEELLRHGLLPTLPKSRKPPRPVDLGPEHAAVHVAMASSASARPGSDS